MSEFNTGLPSIRQIQSYIKEKKQVQIKVSTGDVLVGSITWQDAECVCLMDKQHNQPVMLWRQSLVYVRLNAG